MTIPRRIKWSKETENSERRVAILYELVREGDSDKVTAELSPLKDASHEVLCREALQVEGTAGANALGQECAQRTKGRDWRKL